MLARYSTAVPASPSSDPRSSSSNAPSPGALTGLRYTIARIAQGSWTSSAWYAWSRAVPFTCAVKMLANRSVCPGATCCAMLSRPSVERGRRCSVRPPPFSPDGSDCSLSTCSASSSSCGTLAHEPAKFPNSTWFSSSVDFDEMCSAVTDVMAQHSSSRVSMTLPVAISADVLGCVFLS